MLVKDTVEPGEPVELLRFVLNADEPMSFPNDVQLHYVTVETADGHTVQPGTEGITNRTSFPETKLTLPSGSMLGQLVDLSCIGDPYPRCLQNLIPEASGMDT